MRFPGSSDGPHNPTRPVARFVGWQEQERRRAGGGRLGAGSLACPRCDAPVAIGPGGFTPAHGLVCPWCEHAAPLRDFLSLAVPTRPARVVVRVHV